MFDIDILDNLEELDKTIINIARKRITEILLKFMCGDYWDDVKPAVSEFARIESWEKAYMQQWDELLVKENYWDGKIRYWNDKIGRWELKNV